MAHRGGIDFFGAVGLADGRQEIAERKNTPHHLLVHSERIGNLAGLSALLDQLRKLLPLRNLVGIFADKIFNQGRFQGGGIVAFLQYRARERSIAAAFFGNRNCRMIAPPSRDDFKTIGAAVRANQERHKNTPHPNRGQYIANVGRLLGISHIGR